MAAVPEPSSLGADRMAARLNSPVISSNGPALPDAIAPGPALKVRVEERFHIPAQTSLIAFQADHVIGLPSNDPPANPAPASHRINGHDGTLDRQKDRQFDLSSTLRCFGTGRRISSGGQMTFAARRGSSITSKRAGKTVELTDRGRVTIKVYSSESGPPSQLTRSRSSAKNLDRAP